MYPLVPFLAEELIKQYRDTDSLYARIKENDIIFVLSPNSLMHSRLSQLVYGWARNENNRQE